MPYDEEDFRNKQVYQTVIFPVVSGNNRMTAAVGMEAVINATIPPMAEGEKRQAVIAMLARQMAERYEAKEL